MRKDLAVCLVVCGLCGVAFGERVAPVGAGILGATRVTAGFCVHVGATDGVLEAELTNGGRMLVDGLTRDEVTTAAARATIRARGVYGLATVRTVRNFKRLPYADNMVNLLVADLDGLGAAAPGEKEIMRVVAPKGMAYVKRRGAWRAVVKPRPRQMDDWTHFDYGADGNAVSHDAMVAPPVQVQWISGTQPMKLGGNPAGFSGSSGIRVAGGRVFSDALTGKGKTRPRYGAWDAFNGVGLWQIESDYRGNRRALQVVAVGERVYMFSKPGGPLVALDAASGSVVRTYKAAGLLPRQTGLAAVRVCEGKLVVTNAGRLHVIDAASGKEIWQYASANKYLLFFPSVDAAGGKVFVAESGAGASQKIEHRWPNATASAVLCLSLATGKVLWRCEEVAGKQIGQLVPHGGTLGVFAGGGIGAGRSPFIAAIRVSDGKLLWTGTFKPTWNRAGYVMLWRDDVMYYADPWRIFRLDPATGAETPVFGRSYNGRCMRFCATEKYFIHSFVAYVDTNFRGVLQSVSRSACANSAVPANGMMYFTPNACGCFTMLRGHIALTPEPLWPATADADRLHAPARRKPGVLARTAIIPPPAKGLIVDHWSAWDLARPAKVRGVTAGGRTYTAITHQHRVECLDESGGPIWAFTADGRISSAPIVRDGLCIFGCHDGRVYAVRTSDGSPAWRFQAARNERLIVAYGQLESSWPVYGVTMHGGLVCASAGRHAEIGGGIALYGLDVRTGRPVWQRVLAKPPAVIEATQRLDGVIFPRSVLNDVLQSDGRQLGLPAGRGAPFTFTPDMTNEQLKAKLLTPRPKRR